MAPTEKKVYEISWITLWRILIFVSLASVFFMSRKIMLGLFISIIISSGLEFIVDFLERRGLPRSLGVIVVFLSGALLLVLLFYAIIPLLIVDVNSAIGKLAKLSTGGGSTFGPILSRQVIQSLSSAANQMSQSLLGSGAAPLSAISDLLGNLALAVSVFITSFYLSLSHDGVRRFILSIIPEDSEDAILRIYERSLRRIGYWFRTQLLLSVIMGGLVYITLSILGVKYALFISLLTAIFELVPFIGPIAAGSVAFLSAIVTQPESMSLALYTLFAFVALHQLENHVLVPLIVGRNLGLHPVAVIISLLIGLEIGGFLGAIVAVPMTVILQEALENWSETKKSRRLAVG